MSRTSGINIISNKIASEGNSGILGVEEFEGLSFFYRLIVLCVLSCIFDLGFGSFVG